MHDQKNIKQKPVSRLRIMMEMQFCDLLQVCDSGQSDTCYIAAWNSDAPPAEVELFLPLLKSLWKNCL